jgi:acyl phosphate:glycerol-3-phosphate acyltransferase
MQAIIAVAMVIVGYLSGSVSSAILISRVVAGIDIRTVGNGNPGAANVSRNVGRGWGFLVFFLDFLKGMAPVLLASLVFHPESSVLKHAVLGLVGAAAILGHRKPIFFNFSGGGAIAASIGVLCSFVPVEVGIALGLGFVLAMGFFRTARHTVGQWTPILFLTILPFLTLAANAWLEVTLFVGLKLGGHPWEVPVIVFVIVLFILAINGSFMVERMGEIRS